MTTFYRLARGKALYSFGDPIGQVPVLGKTLAQCQEENIQAARGLLKTIGDEKEIAESDYFLFEEDLYFSRFFVAAAQAMVDARKAELPKHARVRFVLNQNTFNERYSLPDSTQEGEYLKFSFYYCQGNQLAGRAEVEWVVPQQIFEHFIRLPKQIVKEGALHYDQCDTFISRLASPFHLLNVNMAVNLERTVHLQKRLPQWITKKWAPIGSRNYYRALRSLNKIGKNCKIHKTAVLEGVVLGDNVAVGANTVIRMSQIGTGTVVEDNSSVCFSVLGKNNFVSTSNYINVCMTYDDVFLIHGPYQFSIFGNGVAVMAVINCDIRLDQKNIVIPTDNGLVDSRQPLLGVAYGHASVVGGGNIIAPGRIVPNGYKITPPQNIITKFE